MLVAQNRSDAGKNPVDAKVDWELLSQRLGTHRTKASVQQHWYMLGRFDGEDGLVVGTAVVAYSPPTAVAAWLRRMADRIKIPPIVCERAEELYKQLYETKNLRGRKTEGVLAAVLFIACKQEGEPRTFKDIGVTMECPQKELHKCYKMALTALNITVVRTKPADLIARYCARMEIKNYGVICAAKHVAKVADAEDIGTGKNTISVAAACIHLICQLSEPATQRSYDAIAAVTGVGAGTIAKAYSDIYLHRQTLVPIGVDGIMWVPIIPVDCLLP